MRSSLQQKIKKKMKLKHYRCPKCKNKTSAYGLIPECKCTDPKTDMVEVSIETIKKELKK